MAIVMISSKYQAGREELAGALARKTNWPVMSREDLQDQAREMGIKVGRLETSVIKEPGFSEKLAREKDLYLVFTTMALSERARQGNLIYNGRAGHLLLPGVSHRLRVGVTAPREERIRRTSRALNINSDKAASYIDQLDGDIDSWIRWVHRADGRSSDSYDVVFNLENMALSNAADVLCSMAGLPDFRPTPASTKTLDDLYLTSRAKLRLMFDERTHGADLHVHAENGVVTVTYPPHQDYVSGQIPRVLADLEGCREIQCTMAETNILWVQERFESGSENFQQIVRVAARWGAAVELLRNIPAEEASGLSASLEPAAEGKVGPASSAAFADGGVEDDDPEADSGGDDGGLDLTEEELVGLGRFGGRHTVAGGPDKILEAVQGNGQYSLVVIGDMFLSKGHSTRTRRTRELAMTLRDRLKAPVITADELQSRFLFGPRQAVKLVGLLIILVAIYLVAFTHQEPILDFLSGTLHQHYKWLTPIAVALFVPTIAYLYGTVAELALKIINID